MLSEPNQCAAVGPWRATPRKVVVGSFSGREPANTAASRGSTRHTTDAPNQKPSCRLRYVSSDSVSTTPWSAASDWASTSSTDMAHPWIEDPVEHVDEEVDHDEPDRDHHHDALHDEEVLLEDGSADQRAEPRQRED